MFSINRYPDQKPVVTAALSAGALWGIFECTFGYIVHLFPISLGFLIWYPAACFFLTKAYRESGKPNAVLLTAALASMIKLLNLMLPGRIDRVINPAVSIIFEGIALWAVVFVFNQLDSKLHNSSHVKAALVLGANSLWRLMFAAYLAVLVPGWMRDISVLRSSEALIRFLVIENLAGSAVAWAGYLVLNRIKGRLGRRIPELKIPATGLSVGLLIAANIGLQFLLK